MFSDSIYLLHLEKLKKHEKLQKKGGLLISEIPDLQIYTIKTLLINGFQLRGFFLGPKNNMIREMRLRDSSNRIVFGTEKKPS